MKRPILFLAFAMWIMAIIAVTVELRTPPTAEAAPLSFDFEARPRDSSMFQYPAYQIIYGPTLPPVCNHLTGDVFQLRAGAATDGIYNCTALNTWTRQLPDGTGTLTVNATTADAIIFNVTGFENLGAWRRLDAGFLHWHIQNPGTGFTDTDGTVLGIETGGQFRINQLENTFIEFYTQGLHRWGIGPNGEAIWVGTTFAALVASPDGSIMYCTDCTIANPCAGAGTGAFAKRLNGVWVCN
ncbi:MAG: hypothetical protein GY950_00755 [bacterium]|nr:hypothetical protein [bacterium]